MQKIKERRKEKRLHYELPVRFTEATDGTFLQGLMVDISSIGMAFICEAYVNCPSVNQNLTMQFSIPRLGTSSPDMQQIARTGRVLRIDDLNDGRHRVAIQFDDPPFWNLPPNVK
jgi:c-di-GMP-binding flagellar brake protein YcgR